MIKLKPILFSAVQPSGQLTIGNYIGTMRHWSNLQNHYQCLYCIADLHALTTFNKEIFFKESVLDTLALYLACGIDPEKSIIFIQSHVHQHCQLNWILNCFSHFGELSRMTQFKTKIDKNYIKKINVGLFTYPILMASDILLYQTTFVPIGQDQKQHLELVRDIAKRCNFLYGNVFTIPKPCIHQSGSKIMSLLEPTKKMSKSDLNKNNVIFLLEQKKSIFLKIKNAVTDSEKPSKIYYNLQKKAGISNLLEILSAITNKEITFLEKELDGIMYSEFKNIIAEELYNFLSPIKESFLYYRNNTSYLEKVAYEGALKARLQADLTLHKIYSKLNFFSSFK
ncbi:tryptophan--tRNA ligase [Buchnera aphidicola]|uniref:tryptophan--tRNA ligase n=1 Tax=Buchnera aphidicola TaxID=9 RepID=UPI003464AAE1